MDRPRRLSKVARTLNIGISTIVDFLKSEGIQISSSPNTKISAETYRLLLNRFEYGRTRENSKPAQVLNKRGDQDRLDSFKVDKEEIASRRKKRVDKDITQIDIWKAHIEAQELLLTTLPPFYLNPESITEVSKGQYRANLDFTNYRELANDYLKRLFHNSESIQVDFDSGILTVPESQVIDSEYFNSIYEIALSNYLKLYNQPAIMFRVDAENTEENSWAQISDEDRDGIIEAKRGVAYLSISEIERLNNVNNGIDTDGKYGAVLNVVKPSYEFYQYAFNQLNISFADFRADRDDYSFHIYNQWINEKEMNEIFSLGLFHCSGIELIVRVEDNEYLFYDEGHPVYIQNKQGKFKGNSHRRNLGVLLQKDSLYQVNNPIIRLPNPHPDGYFLFKVDSTIHPREFSLYRKRILDKLQSVFGNCIKTEYRYVFTPQNLFDQHLDGWRDYIQQNLSEGISFNTRQNIISFDFDSRQDLERKVNSLRDIHFLDTKNAFGKGHYYKVPYKYDNELIFLKNIIRQHYPTINIVQAANKRSLICSLHYDSGDVYSKNVVLNKLKTEVSDLLKANSIRLNVISKDENRDYYPIEFRSEDIESDLTGLLRKIRGGEFGLRKDGKFIPVGRLQKVKYPVLIFDTSGFTDSFNVEGIVPFYGNFKGDQDKLKRLKSTIDKIYSDKGSGCLNPRVKDFMHDASLLDGEEDIDRLQVYIDLKEDVSKNLLGKRVNDKQLEAVAKSLFARDLFVIQGPPGTGKSTGISEITWQHIRQNELSNKKRKDFKILITSETNLAVDNALDKLRSNEHVLIKPARFGLEEKLDKEGLRFSIPLIDKWVASGLCDENVEEIEGCRDGNDLYTDDNYSENIVRDWMYQIVDRSYKVSSSVNMNYLKFWKLFLTDPDYSTRKVFRDKYVAGVNVVGSTCSTIGKTSSTGNPTGFFRDYCSIYHPDKHIKSVRSIEFDVAIQDEASKASPPELAIPMVYARKNIVIGDHRQLPPLVNPDDFIEEIKLAGQKSKDPDKLDKVNQLVKFIRRERSSFDKSYFERIYDKVHPSLKTSFNTQYRMHSSINNVIRQFYINDNGLDCGLDYKASNSHEINAPSSRYHGINIPGVIDEDKHVVWINTNSAESIDNTSRSRYNLGEIDVVRRLLEMFSENESFRNYNENLTSFEDREIGVITFYGAQLKRMKDIDQPSLQLDLRVSSVDRFQGMERNIVIVSTVRSNKLATYDGQQFDETLLQRGLGFADSPNRLNVALSRAKRLLIIVGNSDHFTSELHGKKSFIYRNVLNEILTDPSNHCHFVESSKLFAE